MSDGCKYADRKLIVEGELPVRSNAKLTKQEFVDREVLLLLRTAKLREIPLCSITMRRVKVVHNNPCPSELHSSPLRLYFYCEECGGKR